MKLVLKMNKSATSVKERAHNCMIFDKHFVLGEIQIVCYCFSVCG